MTMGDIGNKPRIPSPNPRIPTSKNLQANILETTHYSQPGEDLNMDQLLDTINKGLHQPAISKEEVLQGWYYGKEEEKKLGTPNSWIWVDEGVKSRWVSPYAIEDASQAEQDKLCTKTGGTYIISCLEREADNCQYVSKSECHCAANTTWVDRQGCVMTDDNDDFVQITPDELRRGWYSGAPYQKKLNTPLSWIWEDTAGEARWQNSRPSQ